MRYLVVLSAAIFLGGCVANAVRSRDVRVDGYARYAGELMIFESPASPPDDLTNRPRCLSGVPSKGLHARLGRFDHKHVKVIGHLVAYDSLPDEGGTRGSILPRKTADGFIVSNFCRGSQILIMDSIAVVD